MYIWIILAMFITALYGFNLHVRSDSNALYVEPQAQMLVSKIALQHDVSSNFFSYVNEKVTSEMKLEEAMEVCEGKDEYGNCTKISYSSQASRYAGGEDPFNSAVARQIDANYNRLSDIPMNFDVVEHMNNSFIKSFARMDGTNLAKNSHSRVFCVKSKDITNPVAFESANFHQICDADAGGAAPGINCCYGVDASEVEQAKTGKDKSGGALYIVTYAPIPIRWQQRSEGGVPTGMPNKDMIRAFRHFGLTNVEFGYLVDRNHLGWGEDSAAGGGTHGFDISEEDEGGIRDIQTNAMTDYAIGDFQYFIKGFKDTPVGIPTIVGTELAKNCGTGGNNKAGCIVAISQVK